MNRPKGKHAWMVTVGEKGQFVIPKQAREIFGIKPGDNLTLFSDKERGIAIPPKSSFDELTCFRRNRQRKEKPNVE